MRPLPDFLPGRNSRKWHGRRIWDPIGYQRVHGLEHPVSASKATWLAGYLAIHRWADEPTRSQIDAAAIAAKSFAHLKRRPRQTDEAFTSRQDKSWDVVLDALDTYLRAFQLHHLKQVSEAGASGLEVDRKLDQLRE